jgi:hypothetical protein
MQNAQKQTTWTIPNQPEWQRLVGHFTKLSDYTKQPTGQWYKETEKVLAGLDRETYRSNCLQWLRQGQAEVEDLAVSWNFGDHLHDYPKKFFLYNLFFKGVIHSAVLLNDPQVNGEVEKLGLAAFRLGSTGRLVGNDCLHVFSLLPPAEGIPRLAKFRAKVKQRYVQQRIDTYLKKAGKQRGLSADEMEEMLVPTYGLSAEHGLAQSFGPYTATFRISSFNHCALTWQQAGGKTQVSVPAAVKTGFAEAWAAFKGLTREIEGQLSVQRDRLESTYLKDRCWQYTPWLEGYIHHPLVGVLGKRLIWHFESRTLNTEGIWAEGGFTDLHGQPIPLDKTVRVTLWHPITATAERVAAWRQYLMDRGICQPFKQAFREVYLLTDAELRTVTYSNRFAAHILRKDRMAGLCKARGWTPSAMRSAQPTRTLPHLGLKVEFWVEDVYLGEGGQFGGSAHVGTDQVRFYRNGEPLALIDVPALLFSELMRDVDLFVGVTSIGNDPNWSDRGNRLTRHYWHSYSFGDLNASARVREAALRNIVPKLRIAARCAFEGNFLKVQGTLRTYKIHLGSGNILMEPNDQYLCIVPDRHEGPAADRVFLPFDGDAMLSIILSKAFLLAADHQITDPTITRQLRG